MRATAGGNRLKDVLPGAQDVRIYVDDLELLEELIKDPDYQVEVLTEDSPDGTFDIKVAKITRFYIEGDEREQGWVLEIWRCDLPAQFFSFRILDSEGNQHLITTGSGSLKSYWPTLELVGEAMWYQHSEED